LKWEISNREIRRFEIWFKISGANRGKQASHCTNPAQHQPSFTQTLNK